MRSQVHRYVNLGAENAAFIIQSAFYAYPGGVTFGGIPEILFFGQNQPDRFLSDPGAKSGVTGYKRRLPEFAVHVEDNDG
jgi:hypothetical protein